MQYLSIILNEQENSWSDVAKKTNKYLFERVSEEMTSLLSTVFQALLHQSSILKEPPMICIVRCGAMATYQEGTSNT